ncbi:MAG: pyridoxal-dependent decarboxylase [Candidatus Peregrinibacteria bacterium]|nr:pyridoxal-dependent decarboxylase [Candidatus Peregrinibacteria bacterium]
MSKGLSTIGEQLAELTNARPEHDVATAAGPETDKGLLQRLTEDIRTGIAHIAERLDAMEPRPTIPTQWLLEQTAKLLEKLYVSLQGKRNRVSRQRGAFETTEAVRTSMIGDIEGGIKTGTLELDTPISEQQATQAQVTAMLATLTQSIGLRLSSGALGVLIPREDVIDPLQKYLRRIADEITLHTRESVGSYASITSANARPEAHLKAVQRSLDSVGHLDGLLNSAPPINGPASLNSMAHQYAQPTDGTFVIPLLVSQGLQTNAAHGALAGVDRMRERNTRMALDYFGCTPEKNPASDLPEPIFIGVDSGTRGNELGVRYLLRLARLGPAFFEALTKLQYLSRIPFGDEHVKKFFPEKLSNGDDSAQEICLQDIAPHEAAALPPSLIFEFFAKLKQSLKKYDKHPEARKRALEELHSAINEAMHSGLPQGQETVVFCSELLHYTLQQAINGERRQETVTTIPSDEHQRTDFRSYEAQIEQSVKDGKQVVLFAAAGNTSFGSFDEFNFLADLKQRLQQTHGRSFLLHVDAAWGWTVRSVILCKDGKPKSWETVKEHPIFDNEQGKALYDSLLRIPEAFDTLTFDAHKDAAPYSSAGFLAKEPWFMASLLTEKVPYLDVDTSAGHADVDAIRTSLCSHPPTVDSYMYLTLESWKSGVMGQRYKALLDSAHWAERGLENEKPTLPDGRIINIIPVTDQSSRIITLNFIPEGATDVQEIHDLNMHIASTFDGSPKSDGVETGGIHLSKTMVAVKSCPGLRGLTPTLEHINVVRLVITNDRQMQTSTEVEGWGGSRGHLGYVMHHIQQALGQFKPGARISHSHDEKSAFADVSAPASKYQSPILAERKYPVPAFFRDVLELLKQQEAPQSFSSFTQDPGIQRLVTAFDFDPDQPGCVRGLLRTLASIMEDTGNCDPSVRQAMQDALAHCAALQASYKSSKGNDTELSQAWGEHAPAIASALTAVIGNSADITDINS